MTEPDPQPSRLKQLASYAARQAVKQGARKGWLALVAAFGTGPAVLIVAAAAAALIAAAVVALITIVLILGTLTGATGNLYTSTGVYDTPQLTRAADGGTWTPNSPIGDPTVTGPRGQAGHRVGHELKAGRVDARLVQVLTLIRDSAQATISGWFSIDNHTFWVRNLTATVPIAAPGGGVTQKRVIGAGTTLNIDDRNLNNPWRPDDAWCLTDHAPNNRALTCRQSRHKRGRAVDIPEINGHKVADSNRRLPPDADTALTQRTRDAFQETYRLVWWLTCVYSTIPNADRLEVVYGQKLDAVSDYLAALAADNPTAVTDAEKQLARLGVPPDAAQWVRQHGPLCHPAGWVVGSNVAHNGHIHLGIVCGPRWIYNGERGLHEIVYC